MVFEDEARAPLAAGVEKLARAVRSTLGPRGRNAVLDKGWGSPKITKDGVTVAEDIELDDPYENLGAQLVKEAASKTNDVAGDGTTTATVLADGIFREGLKMIAAGADPMALSRGIQKAVEAVTEAITKQAEPVDVSDKKRLQQIATIAGNNDPTIGAILADAFTKVGKDGVITVDEGRGNETTVEVVEGMQFDRGYLSPHFVTNEDDQEVELDNCLVLIYEEKISNAKSLVPLSGSRLEGRQAAADHRRRRRRRSPRDAGGQQAPRHPAGVCREGPRLRRSSQGDARRHRDPHRRDGHLQGPRHQARRRAALRPRQGRSVIIITSDNTTIVGGGGKKEEIHGRAEQIRREIETTDSDYDREKLQERLAKLAGGVAQIKVGAATETEMKERKALFDDARAATQAALAEGIVAGGGVALLRAEKALKKLELDGRRKARRRDRRATCCHYPLRYIAENAGVDGAVVVNRVRQMKGKNDGYNADKDEYCDLVAAGVIDPGEGRAHRAAERRERRGPAAHHRFAHHRNPEGRRRSRRRPRPRPRHGWHGRNGRRHGRHGWHGRHDVRGSCESSVVSQYEFDD